MNSHFVLMFMQSEKSVLTPTIYNNAFQDFANLDMGRYLHGGVNMTGFQLIDLSSKHVQRFMRDWNGAPLGATYPDTVPNKLTVCLHTVRRT